MHANVHAVKVRNASDMFNCDTLSGRTAGVRARL